MEKGYGIADTLERECVFQIQNDNHCVRAWLPTPLVSLRGSWDVRCFTGPPAIHLLPSEVLLVLQRR